MPIPVKVRDSESQVRVHPKSEDKVEVKSGCKIDIKALESELQKEKEERIAADADLQEQIDDLTDNIQLDFTDDPGEEIEILDPDTGQVIRTITLKAICLKHIPHED